MKREPVPPPATQPAELSLRKLERFLAIVRAGSLSRAADRLGVSQPALSRELRELEQQFGLPLLHRHARGIALTPGGEALRQRAEALLTSIATLKQDVQAGSDQPSGRVVFGMPPSLAEVLTAPLVGHMRQHFPAVRLQVREALSSLMYEGLQARDVEVAVVAAPVSDRQLIVRPLMSEPMVVVGPEASGLAPRRPLSLKAVAELPLILPSFPNSARLLIEGALQTVGARPQVVFEADAAPIASFVRRGLGYAVLPSCALSNANMVGPGMVHAPIKGLEITWLVACPAGWALSRAATHLCQALYALAREAAASRRWRGTYLGP